MQFSSRGQALELLSLEQAELRAGRGEQGLSNSYILDVELMQMLQLAPLETAAFGALLQRRQRFFKICAEQGARLLLLSDGRAAGGDDQEQAEAGDGALPCLAGRQLLAMEQSLEASGGLPFILRSGPLLAASGDNFLTACVQRLRRGETMTLDASHTACPTPVGDLARVISGLLDQLQCGAPAAGVYHYNSAGQASAYEFAEVVYAFVSQLLNLPVGEAEALVAQEGAEGWSPPVPELRCERILFDFGIKQLPWRAFLPRLIKTLCEEANQ